jgi:hypothetical protein
MPRIPKNQNHINRHHAADDVGECYGVGWTVEANGVTGDAGFQQNLKE